MTLDLSARRAASEPLWAHPCDFPRVAPSVDSTRHTIGWLAAYSSAAGKLVDRLPDAVAKVEVETGQHSLWLSGLGVVSEPIFVSRPGNGAAHAEDDGWVLSLVYDPASDASNVTVLDARDLSGSLPGCGSITTCHHRSTARLRPRRPFRVDRSQTRRSGLNWNRREE